MMNMKKKLYKRQVTLTKNNKQHKGKTLVIMVMGGNEDYEGYFSDNECIMTCNEGAYHSKSKR